MLYTARCSNKLNQLAEAEWASPLFDRYGRFVARHPRWLIIFSIASTLLLALGALRISVKDDLRFMYTPPRSPAFDEFRVHKDFQKAQNLSYSYVSIEVVSPRQGGNLLTENISRILLRANDYVFNNLTVIDYLNESNRGERVKFGETLCPRLPLCSDSNRVVQVFLQSYFDPDDGLEANDHRRFNFSDGGDQPQNRYTYPMASVYGVNVFLLSNFYNVRLDSAGNLLEVGLIHLTYFYPIRFDDDLESVRDFETEIETYLRRVESEHSRDIRFYIFSMNKLQNEVAQNTFRTLPYLPVSIVVLIVYTLWTTISRSNPIVSKPLEGLMGVCTTLLAVISAYGLMFAWGIPYNSTVAVVPFLTLALAVDDTYIMLAAWRVTDSRWSNERRMGETMSSAGCAITVAMLTDVFAFVVGAFSNTPAIQHFCLFIAAAVAFDYLYQLTFFSSFLALSGRREADGRHCVLVWMKADRAPAWRPRKIAPSAPSPSSSTSGSTSIAPIVRPRSSICDRFFGDNCIENFLKRHYSTVLLNPWFRLAALIIYVLYVGVAFWGCLRLRVNLTPSKLLLDGSELDRYIDQLETYVWPEALISTVYVQRAPDFSSSRERDRFEQFVRALENTPWSVGANSTSLWYRDYTNFLQYLEIDFDEPNVFDRNLAGYLKLHDKQRWKRYLNLSNRSTMTSEDHWSLHVDSFFFTTAFRLGGWTYLSELVRSWREICSNYSEFRPIVFENNNFYADQIASLAPNVIQDTGIAFFCMIVAGALFIPNVLILFWVTWSLFSMNLGVVGLLALWGCDLDPTAVTSILLSIGLTVDYTLHVAYHYHKSHHTRMRCMDSERGEKRRVLEETLTVAGWPLIQGGLSTTLAVVALFFVPSYVIGVFLRTVLLVVLLGLLHALIYLPLLLTSVSLDRPRRLRVVLLQ